MMWPDYGKFNAAGSGHANGIENEYRPPQMVGGLVLRTSSAAE